MSEVGVEGHKDKRRTQQALSGDPLDAFQVLRADVATALERVGVSVIWRPDGKGRCHFCKKGGG